jgi:retron-type reverse transcriptase
MIMYYGDYLYHARLLGPRPQSVIRSRKSESPQFSDHEPPLEAIINSDRLIKTYWRLARDNGRAAGIDGLKFHDLGPREVANVMRRLTGAIWVSCYLPQPAREVSIPKAAGGERVLRIPTILDRVVAASLTDALTPFWNPRFLPSSFGFRPHLSAWKMLAHLSVLATAEGLPVLVVEDIAGAFDNVRLDHLMQDHVRHIQSPDLLWLVEAILHGWSARGRRTKGIDQGNPYSPLALNVRLHHAHDVPMSQAHHGVSLRYADNHVYSCADFAQAERVKSFAIGCLAETGLKFKERGRCCIDLRDQTSTPVLGFRMQLVGGRMRYRLGESVLADLRAQLLKAHSEADPPRYAGEIVKGWISAYGPVWGIASTSARARRHVLAALTDLALGGACIPEEINNWQRSASLRWRHLVHGVQAGWASLRERHGLGGTDAPPT